MVDRQAEGRGAFFVKRAEGFGGARRGVVKLYVIRDNINDGQSCLDFVD
jgi:hypothetical protein